MYLTFIVLLNFFCLRVIGSYLLRSILFPYSNYFIERKLNSEINRKFSLEFSKLILTLSKIVRIMADLESIEYYNKEDNKSKAKEEFKKEIEQGDEGSNRA